ncbi:MAG: hypothetical protein IT535_00660 [Bauldia sp.]|nr:hypothetical protein [Bauldia sp.]
MTAEPHIPDEKVAFGRDGQAGDVSLAEIIRLALVFDVKTDGQGTIDAANDLVVVLDFPAVAGDLATLDDQLVRRFFSASPATLHLVGKRRTSIKLSPFAHLVDHTASIRGRRLISPQPQPH